MSRVKPAGLLCVALVVAAIAAAQPDDLLDRARLLEQSLAEWNERVAAGEAALVLEELDRAGLDESERQDPRLWNLRGVCLLRLDRAGEAVLAFETAIRADPSRAETHRNLAVALHGLGQIGRSMSEFGQALELAPDDLEARLGLAGAQLTLRRPVAAAATLDELTPQQRLDPRALLLRARSADGIAESGAALIAWRELEEAVPSAESARRLAELDLPGARERWLRLCIERDADAGDCRAALAQLLLQDGQPAAAAAQLQLLAEAGPLEPRNLHNLLLALQAEGDWDGIEACVARQEPVQAASWGVLALSRRAAGDAAGALQAARRGREADPEDLDLANLMAVLLAEGGRGEEARRVWEWILERNPQHVDALRNLGG